MPGPGLAFARHRNRLMPLEEFRSNLAKGKAKKKITVLVNTQSKKRAAGKQVRLTSRFAGAFNAILAPALPE